MKRTFFASFSSFSSFSGLLTVAIASLPLVALMACAAESGANGDPAETAAGSGEEAATTTIAVTTFDDPDAEVPTTPVHRIFTSAQSYRSFFGNDAPASVSFAKSWVVFYGAGTENTGGYTTTIPSVTRSTSGKTIKITTALDSPGKGCLVPMHVTNPHVFAKIPKQTALYVTYSAKNTAASCEPAACAGLGQHDASGACTCTALAKCAAGTQFNSDPDVCACTSLCATVRCVSGTHCETAGNAVSCVPDFNPCAAAQCLMGTECTPDPTGQQAQCVRIPGGCSQDADCTLHDNYCGGCSCDALGWNHKPATCNNPVNCLVEPCAGVTVKCEAGRCVKH